MPHAAGDSRRETTVIEPGRKFKQLATNTLDDGFLASPAVADGAFFLRTKTQVYRIENTAAASE